MKAGWETKPLSELCIVDWGNTDLTKASYVEAGEYLAVSAAGCDGRIGHKEHSKYTPVLSAIGAQCGRMFFPEEDFTAIKNTITLTPREGVCTGKFLYQLFSYVDLPKRGAAQPFISKGDIQSFQVTVPASLQEQQRIVAIVDEAFSGIATARAAAEQNRQNARALFESHLQSVFSQRGEGWVETTIGELCILKSGTSVSVSLEKQSGDLPYVKVSDMSHEGNETEILSSSRFLDMADIGKNAVFPVGTTIFPKRGGAILTNKKRLTAVPICADLNIMGVIPPEGFSARLLYHYFLNVDMRLLGSGSSIPQINNYDIAPLPISFPEDQEQQDELAQELDALREETQRLEALYQRKLEALDELKQSLLYQAFSGQL